MGVTFFCSMPLTPSLPPQPSVPATGAPRLPLWPYKMWSPCPHRVLQLLCRLPSLVEELSSSVLFSPPCFAILYSSPSSFYHVGEFLVMTSSVCSCLVPFTLPPRQKSSAQPIHRFSARLLPARLLPTSAHLCSCSPSSVECPRSALSPQCCLPEFGSSTIDPSPNALLPVAVRWAPVQVVAVPLAGKTPWWRALMFVSVPRCRRAAESRRRRTSRTFANKSHLLYNLLLLCSLHYKVEEIYFCLYP